MAGEKSVDLDDILDSESLCWLAGDRTFGRGEAYAKAGVVQTLRRRDGGVEAVVRGSDLYTVRLGIVGGALDYACTCPIGRDVVFCKHCVAVALVWRDGTLVVGEAPMDDQTEADGTGGEPGAAEIRDYLAGLGKDELVAMLVDQAREDNGLRRRLTLRAARTVAGPAAMVTWKQTLGEVLAIDHETSHHYWYDEDDDFDVDLDDLAASLGDLLKAGEVETVIQLAEHGIAEVEEALGHIDDSNGVLADLLDGLQMHHLEACRLARPDPVDLAERLFEFEMESEFGVMRNAVEVYADMLGESGLATYRRLAEAEWARVPILGPGETDPNRYGSHWHIKLIMQAFARMDGGVEAMVAINSRDLSLPYNFLEIAALYHDADDADRALEWAERGWRAFADSRPDERLRGYLADLYQERGRHDEAMALMWDSFSENPGLHFYRDLEERATRAGQWPSWRERALALLRELCAPEKSSNPSKSDRWGDPPRRDHSPLVEVFLYEGDVDAAWSEAENGGCSSGLWLNLAKRGEKQHPDRSVNVYTRHIKTLLRNTGDRVYEEAVTTLARIKKLQSRSGEKAAFGGLVLEIRATHRRKRKLMGMLDKQGW